MARIDPRIRILSEHVRSVPHGLFTVNLELNSNVIDLSLFPGLRAEHIEALLLGSVPIHGLLLRTYGTGNAPNDRRLLGVIAEAVRSGVVALSVTHCLQGAIESGQYVSGTTLSRAGVVSGLDMTPEAALTKLMFVLNCDSNRARELLQEDLRGELTPIGLNATRVELLRSPSKALVG